MPLASQLLLVALISYLSLSLSLAIGSSALICEKRCCFKSLIVNPPGRFKEVTKLRSVVIVIGEQARKYESFLHEALVLPMTTILALEQVNQSKKLGYLGSL